jgi:hypothetical protein
LWRRQNSTMGTANITGITCNACGTALPTARPDDPATGRIPCPVCGSTSRNIAVEIHEVLTFEEHLDTHSKHPRPEYRGGSRSKPALERWAGEVSSRDGVWRVRLRLVDRLQGWYEETVLNPDGTVRHHQAEPLKKHTRHGSDRKPRA